MSRTFPSIQGVPFRKIISRAYKHDYVVETLSCGHTNSTMPEESNGITKRRCYHRDCKIKRAAY